MKKRTFSYWISVVWIWICIIGLGLFIGTNLVALYKDNHKMFIQLFLLEFSIISFFLALAKVLRG